MKGSNFALLFGKALIMKKEKQRDSATRRDEVKENCDLEFLIRNLCFLSKLHLALILGYILLNYHHVEQIIDDSR